jgi:hypothetical protein
VRIQDVKPRVDADPAAVRAAFAELLADESAADAAEPPIPSGQGPRYAHPWFGPIDAFRWHGLLALHQRIHRRQIEAIRAGLGTLVAPR